MLVNHGKLHKLSATIICTLKGLELPEKHLEDPGKIMNPHWHNRHSCLILMLLAHLGPGECMHGIFHPCKVSLAQSAACQYIATNALDVLRSVGAGGTSTGGGRARRSIPAGPASDISAFIRHTPAGQDWRAVLVSCNFASRCGIDSLKIKTKQPQNFYPDLHLQISFRHRTRMQTPQTP